MANGKPGRPSKVKGITAAQVEALARIGCTQVEIGEIHGVAHSQISRHFAQPYKRGIAKCKKSLRRKQIAVANKSKPAMLIWLGKQFLGQKEPKSEHDVTSGGKPLAAPTLVIHKPEGTVD